MRIGQIAAGLHGGTEHGAGIGEMKCGIAIYGDLLSLGAGGPHIGLTYSSDGKKFPCPIYARVLCGHMWEAMQPRTAAFDATGLQPGAREGG